MKAGYASEWFASRPDEMAKMRAGADRSSVGYPQLIHNHVFGAPCDHRCEHLPAPGDRPAPEDRP